MSYEFYKVLHVLSVLVLFTSLGTLAIASSREGERLQRLARIAHGVALVIIFVAGFGLMARLGMFGSIPAWAWAKIVLWLGLGLIVMPMRRRPDWAVWLWSLVSVGGALAVWLAVQKPF